VRIDDAVANLHHLIASAAPNEPRADGLEPRTDIEENAAVAGGRIDGSDGRSEGDAGPKWLDLRIPRTTPVETGGASGGAGSHADVWAFSSTFVAIGGVSAMLGSVQAACTVESDAWNAIADWRAFSSVPGFAAASTTDPLLRAHLLQLCVEGGLGAAGHRGALRTQLPHLLSALTTEVPRSHHESLTRKDLSADLPFFQRTEVLDRLLLALTMLTKVRPRTNYPSESARSGNGGSGGGGGGGDDNGGGSKTPSDAAAAPSAVTELGRKAAAAQFWEKGTGFGSGTVRFHR
jgi:hypothetical protein